MRESLWKRKLPAGYTVEATYVMAIVLLALSALIRSGYAKYKEETAVMGLHHIVEQIRGQEQKEEKSFCLGGWNAEVKPYKEKIEGSLAGQGWHKNIEVKIHEPENMMRMMTIFKSKDEG